MMPGFCIFTVGAPGACADIVGELPTGVILAREPKAPLYMAHIFAMQAAGLAATLRSCRSAIKPDGTIRVSWPNKASAIATDLTDVVVRQTALPLDLVGVKIGAVDNIWSGLKFVIPAALVATASLSGAVAQQTMFASRQLTPSGEYTAHIEGPAVDASGNLYVLNFGRDGTIGKLAPGAAHSQLFTSLPAGSIGNGIRFDRAGRMYVADFKKHNVFVIEPGETAPHPYFTSAQFHQPNDLAIAPNGTLYASDPKFPHSGQIWRITRQSDGTAAGAVMSSDRTMGATNGIDLSPEGATLYVSESDNREVWSYRLDGNTLRDPTLGKVPSNLTFGGPDGKTVFVTQVAGRFIESFRVDRPAANPAFTGRADRTDDTRELNSPIICGGVLARSVDAPSRI